MRSLRARLLVVWTVSLLASVAVGLLLVRLYEQSSTWQVGRAEAVAARACDQIAARYAFYVAGWSGPVPALADAGLQRDLRALTAVALARHDGVEGGIWQDPAGPLAYAYPSYQGSGPKTDLPEAERERIAAINRQAARDDQSVGQAFPARSQTLLLHACPLPGPIPDLTAWTMARVQAAGEFDRLRLGLGILLVLMIGLSAGLGWLVLVWAGHLRRIETTLGAAGAEGMPVLASTGERELDRIVGALNEAGRRLAEAQARSASLAAQVAVSERLAALGRVAAGVAHEIRNPIAAIRLKAENGLAGDDARRRRALEDTLGQVARLDALAGELLAMTQRREAVPARVDLPGFLEACVDRHRPQAERGRVQLAVSAPDAPAWFDAEIVGRVLDNLLANAVAHTPESGRVTLSARLEGASLTIEVADTGPGVSPVIADRLFEPFVTGRADGTGLGLAIARELAEAHGGRLSLARAGAAGAGAVFRLDLPGAAMCPPS